MRARLGHGVVTDDGSADSRTRKARLKAALPRILLVARYVLLVAVVAFAIFYFATQWQKVSAVITHISLGALTGSFAIMIIGMLAGVMSWVTLLNGLGHPVPLPRGAQIMLVGQLGKYVPGSVWAYVMQMELGREHGIARARVLVASLYAAGIGVVSSLVLGAFALPILSGSHPQLLWLLALLPVGLVCLHPRVMTWLSDLVLRIFRRPPLEHAVRYSTILRSVGWALLSYVAYGFHLWALVEAGVALTPTAIILFSGALSLGFTASLFAFLLPSGVGVREAVVIGVLSALLPVVQVSAISLVSRAMFTAGDLLLAGAAVIVAIVMRRRLRREDAVYAEYADVAAEDDPDGEHRRTITAR